MLGNRITITGTVQGVGFRPFVYRLARQWGLRGTVKNDSSGVEIFAAGERLDEFIRALTANPPPLARIAEVRREPAEISAIDFTVIESTGGGSRQVDLTVDTAVCGDCLREFNDPHDRRYQYPFIVCTNCGPRYTIIRDLPYDRERTAMAEFPLCPECKREYQDPASRRFHTEPVCCPVCGPQYTGLEQAVTVLKEGGIAAIKGIGGYHLACDAENPDAVARLRQRKHRDEKPFAVMVPDTGDLPLTKTEKQLLQGPERPIVLLDVAPPPGVAPGLHTLGVMLPYAPIHHRLFQRGGFRQLVMTSGNRTDEPMATREGKTRLGHIADCILDHNREIVTRNDDSVVRVLAGAPVFLRRSRGYAPGAVGVDFTADGIIGCGAMLKNSVALGRGKHVYFSPHIGDLRNAETYASLETAAGHLTRMLGITRQAAVCDLHPDYLSTRFAESLGLPVIKVQHHLAHAYSCLAENRAREAVAVVYDGAGYGDDGHTWGGEIFSIKEGMSVREAHWNYMPMAGGDACVEHPRRMAAGILHERGIILPGMEDMIPLLQKKINLHYTSGMGRLFDAAAAVLGLGKTQTYEGQAPMVLEAACTPLTGAGAYETEGLDGAVILEQLYRDTAETGVRAARFHHSVIEATARQVRSVASRTGTKAICLSGGCMQNKLLLEGLLGKLSGDFLVYTHRLVPANDGGIALGQIAYAWEKMVHG
jgi:hydrogenase maturation protein HypF